MRWVPPLVLQAPYDCQKIKSPTCARLRWSCKFATNITKVSLLHLSWTRKGLSKELDRSAGRTARQLAKVVGRDKIVNAMQQGMWRSSQYPRVLSRNCGGPTHGLKKSDCTRRLNPRPAMRSAHPSLQPSLQKKVGLDHADVSLPSFTVRVVLCRNWQALTQLEHDLQLSVVCQAVGSPREITFR